MSATRLLVLGVIRMRGEAHGYQVRRELLSWAADKWANVQPGSVYHALKKLARDGLLDVVGAEGTASGPDRTRYRLTADGDTEFDVLLTRCLSEPERGPAALSAAVTFLTALERERAIQLLQVRLTALGGQLARAEQMSGAYQGLGKPEHVSELYRVWVLAAEMEIRWTKELIARLEKGTYVMADDAPDSFGSRPADQRPTNQA